MNGISLSLGLVEFNQAVNSNPSGAFGIFSKMSESAQVRARLIAASYDEVRETLASEYRSHFRTWLLVSFVDQVTEEMSRFRLLKRRNTQPDLPRENKKICNQVDRLRAARAGNGVEAEVRSYLETTDSLSGFLRLQQMVDAVVRRFPGLYGGSEKMNDEINKVLQKLWDDKREDEKERRGARPHVRRGCPVHRKDGRDHWRRATIVNARFLATSSQPSDQRQAA